MDCCCIKQRLKKKDVSKNSVNTSGLVNAAYRDDEAMTDDPVVVVFHDAPKSDNSLATSDLESTALPEMRTNLLHSVSDANIAIAKREECVEVELISRDVIGLGFSVSGNMAEGVMISEVSERGPAKATGKVAVGDRILSVSIAFDKMVYEDALTILSYASPYPVTLKLARTRTTTPSGERKERVFHPMYRSQSMGVGDDDKRDKRASRESTLTYVSKAGSDDSNDDTPISILKKNKFGNTLNLTGDQSDGSLQEASGESASSSSSSSSINTLSEESVSSHQTIKSSDHVQSGNQENTIAIALDAAPPPLLNGTVEISSMDLISTPSKEVQEFENVPKGLITPTVVIPGTSFLRDQDVNLSDSHEEDIVAVTQSKNSHEPPSATFTICTSESGGTRITLYKDNLTHDRSSLSSTSSVSTEECSPDTVDIEDVVENQIYIDNNDLNEHQENSSNLVPDNDSVSMEDDPDDLKKSGRDEASDSQLTLEIISESQLVSNQFGMQSPSDSGVHSEHAISESSGSSAASPGAEASPRIDTADDDIISAVLSAAAAKPQPLLSSEADLSKARSRSELEEARARFFADLIRSSDLFKDSPKPLQLSSESINDTSVETSN